MAMGKRKRHAKQASMWVATQDLPRGAAHPFYTRLNQILHEHDFDGYVEGLCQRFYADEGRPGLPPGVETVRPDGDGIEEIVGDKGSRTEKRRFIGSWRVTGLQRVSRPRETPSARSAR